MYSKLLLSLVISGVFVFNSACDETPPVSDQFEAGVDIRSLNVSPSDITFQSSDGFTDTTLTISIQAVIYNAEDLQPEFIIKSIDDQALFLSGIMELQDQLEVIVPVYEASVDITTSTTAFEEYTVEVFGYDENGNGSFIQTPLRITGFSNNPPAITETTSPDTLIRPETGSVSATFTATVTDEDGDDTVSRVFLRIIDQETGEVQGSPFDMADDGTSLGDQVADDQVFTWSLPVTQTSNRPDRDYNIEFIALDEGGLNSDTLRTTFHIRGN